MNRGHPIIDGPPPGNWRPLLDAVRAGFARVRRGLATKPARRPAKALPAGATPPSEEALEAERTWIGVHGKPMLWMAPLFLAFALVWAAPHLAKVISPDDPRALIALWVGRLPGWAAPLSGPLAGWLWLPWYVGLPALLLRLNAARITGRAILDAVGSSLAALVLEAAAWLYVGRKLLAGPGVPLVERDGAWQLLVAEFVFLVLASTLLGPAQRLPRYLNQNDR